MTPLQEGPCPACEGSPQALSITKTEFRNSAQPVWRASRLCTAPCKAPTLTQALNSMAGLLRKCILGACMLKQSHAAVTNAMDFDLGAASGEGSFQQFNDPQHPLLLGSLTAGTAGAVVAPCTHILLHCLCLRRTQAAR
eukprot:357480-Chlamydomonas_euryale.AAC.3